jgi:outer membrane receptor protein involved in Fe transport
LVIVLALAVSEAGADTSDLEAALNETVITTASASAERGSSAPAMSTTITAEELRTHGIRFLDEAIDYLSLGVVTSDPLRTADIGARGVLLVGDNGKHFLLLIDGHAMNDPAIGAARFDEGAGIPIEMVDHIEVIVGPGSVLYGSNAMMGVINVITKRSRELDGTTLTAEYELESSYRLAATAGYDFELLGEKAAVTAGIGYFRRFGPDLYFEPQAPTYHVVTGEPTKFRRGVPGSGIWGGTVEDAYFAEVPFGSVRLRWNGWSAMAMASTYRRGVVATSQGTAVDFDDPESYELDRSIRAELQHEAVLSSAVRTSVRLYGDAYDNQRRVNRWALVNCFTSSVETCQRYDATLARWVGIEGRLAIDWLRPGELVTTFGIDARMSWVSAKSDLLDFASGRPLAPSAGLIDGRSGFAAPYVQQVWAPTRAVELNAGARVDADERFDPIVSPRLAAAVRPWEGGTAKAIYSQAFRAPSWVEMDPSNRLQLPSETMRPELVRSAELSFEQRFGAQRIVFGAFRSWWSDLIEPHIISPEERNAYQDRGVLPLSAPDGLYQYRNIANLENWGYNASYGGSVLSAKLSYGINVTSAYTRRVAEGQNEVLTVAPQFFGNAHTSYEFGGLLPTVGAALAYVSARPADRAFDSGFTPPPHAPAQATVRVTATGFVPSLPRLRYRASTTYSLAAEGPYVVGNQRSEDFTQERPFLNPVDTFSAFIGLSYSLDGSAPEGGR